MIFFHFLKIIFDISTSKRSKKYKLYSILIKKNSKFTKTQVQTQPQTTSKRVFGSVVAVAFQIAFRAEKHANNVFLFFKNYF